MFDVLGVVVTRCVNGASPIGFVLSLFYLCAFHEHRTSKFLQL